MPSHDGAALLEARGLQRSFGRVRILHGLDLSLRPGEALAIIGPNGAGKTTLLRLLAGLIRPSAGEVRISGQRRTLVGISLHQSLLYDDLTLLENLTFAARLYGLERPGAVAAPRWRLRAWATVPGTSPTAEPGSAPAGRDRPGDAALSPVLLLDEPFTGLDAQRRPASGPICSARLGQGLGLVLVTHHLAEVWDLATRVAVLVGGRWAGTSPGPVPWKRFFPVIGSYRCLSPPSGSGHRGQGHSGRAAESDRAAVGSRLRGPGAGGLQFCPGPDRAFGDRPGAECALGDLCPGGHGGAESRLYRRAGERRPRRAAGRAGFPGGASSWASCWPTWRSWERSSWSLCRFSPCFSTSVWGALPGILGVAALATIGFVAVGTIFSAMAVRTRFAELMLPVLLLPFMVPPLIGAVQVTTRLLAGRPLSEMLGWLRLLALYDVVFVTLCTLAFSAVVDE